jgi:hypothetical protein
MSVPAVGSLNLGTVVPCFGADHDPAYKFGSISIQDFVTRNLKFSS